MLLSISSILRTIENYVIIGEAGVSMFFPDQKTLLFNNSIHEKLTYNSFDKRNKDKHNVKTS
ncbi:hypothetical protein KUTeg_024373 [Tegillarca granosa]|uniref:Uncharacterized protein n=1 Tax=Tegillarca granosa TaxID=220873 RepID=A0ABQ9E1S5_TEGGR|nr:hypothetical protein KUTeg_024373 [Tegillarca granosa]